MAGRSGVIDGAKSGRKDIWRKEEGRKEGIKSDKHAVKEEETVAGGWQGEKVTAERSHLSRV